MNPMQGKSAEQRKAIAAKSLATRRANIETRKAKKQDQAWYADRLRQQIVEMEERLNSLQRMEALSAVSARLTGKALLREEEISKSALPWIKASGIYFLLCGSNVVYVGQARCVYSRIPQHKDKIFDRYAFVPCQTELLDKLESLYIHTLRPRLNGTSTNGGKLAPIALNSLF